ncbi:hypothetical protein LTR62_002622 [Meristemomyces frigidus]|uniref:Exonuclease 1 n=1 Tax=Meristemomyces frigidus TaxID=1508187 RepID=A0AAN7TJH6_9PEZI|nr:hypothetical protein LTR62_002622 [Meristemomyces frigidus]
MGIQGLLPLLKSIHKPTHLRNFAGQTLGVDAYGWLHRGTVSCAIELAQQKPTRKHIEFALSRVRMLLHFGVKPLLVFDGDYLPSKEHTEKERAARRKESRKAGLELLRMGRVSQAHLELQKAVDVSPLMARELIEELKRLDVPYIVAPYEADSQMAYLEKKGMIDGIVSEDSDLLVFGTQCLLTKLDQYGECIMINRADFTACREISLVGWTDKEFRIMAMLSGCDYLPGIDNIGLKTAYRLVRKHKGVDRIIRNVQFENKKKVPAGYLEAFARAEHTFLYQWVFCPEAQALVNLNDIPAELDAADMPYIGHFVAAELAAGVALGDLDPNTKERLILPPRAHHQPLVRARTAQTPDEKPGKSIAEFFKARRTPLAELDPNSFTPSPSQQRLLEAQHTASWTTSQVQSAHMPAATQISSGSTPSTAPQPVRRSITAPPPFGSRASPKRQRLCSESLLGSPAKQAVESQVSTSRFFSKQTVQPSPSLRKSSVQRKQESFEVWTDCKTTMTPILSAAPIDVTPSPKKRKKLGVYVDGTADGTELAMKHTSQDSIADPVSERPGHSTYTPGTPTTNEESQQQPSVFSEGINTAFADLKSKWALSREAPQPIAMTRSAPLLPFPITSKVRGANLIAKSVTAKTTTPGNVKPVRKPAVVETLVLGSSPVLEATAADAEVELGNEDDFAIEQGMSSSDHVVTAKGSEDFLVPDSPTGSEGGEDGRHRPKLNWGSFAFAGTV